MTEIFFPEAVPGIRLAKARRPATRAVAAWLWLLAALVLLMVVVGGATRLTESGLSITEWQLVTGVLPPLSHDAWLAEFEKYKQIPQYAKLFPDMDLAQFKSVFFWEWGHRLLGRVIGLALALPLIVFWLRGALPRGFTAKLVGLLALVALQGAVGWWMVTSGLSGRIEVAQERLAIHLILASATFAWLIWLASSLRATRPETRASGHRALRLLAVLIFAVVIVQLGLGALVAGTRAGLTYNTWPLMDGRLIPPAADLTVMTPVWQNFLDNVTMVQFQHRLVAYLVLALGLGQAWLVATRVGGIAARRATLFAALVLAQAAIGITTLVLAVPLWAALLHQTVAMLVLGAVVMQCRAYWPGRQAVASA